MTLSDISYDALKIAQKNSVNTNIKIIQSDLFEKIEEKFDIIVSNPPYIETRTIQTLDKVSCKKKTNAYLPAFKDIYSKKDLSNNDRIVVCKKRSN